MSLRANINVNRAVAHETPSWLKPSASAASILGIGEDVEPWKTRKSEAGGSFKWNRKDAALCRVKSLPTLSDEGRALNDIAAPDDDYGPKKWRSTHRSEFPLYTNVEVARPIRNVRKEGYGEKDLLSWMVGEIDRPDSLSRADFRKPKKEDYNQSVVSKMRRSGSESSIRFVDVPPDRRHLLDSSMRGTMPTFTAEERRDAVPPRAKAATEAIGRGGLGDEEWLRLTTHRESYKKVKNRDVAAQRLEAQQSRAKALQTHVRISQIPKRLMKKDAMRRSMSYMAFGGRPVNELACLPAPSMKPTESGLNLLQNV